MAAPPDRLSYTEPLLPPPGDAALYVPYPPETCGSKRNACNTHTHPDAPIPVWQDQPYKTEWISPDLFL